jgi:N-acetylmuramoyl-L-alanine amidase
VRTPAVLLALLLVPLLSAQEPARPADIIVIDPGHGGDDTGVRGRGGLVEKQLTLDIAQRLKAQLEGRPGLRVLLTRGDDIALGSDARVSLANNNRGTLFLSLHANAAFSASLAGAEIYTSAAADPLAGTEEGQPIALLPWNEVQTRHAAASARLAGLLHDELGRAVPMSPRQVRAAAMRPLVGVNMPAVVIELLYLTNPEQEKLAADDTFKDAIAQKLADAIARYRTPGDLPSVPVTPEEDPAGGDARTRPAEAR